MIRIFHHSALSRIFVIVSILGMSLIGFRLPGDVSPASAADTPLFEAHFDINEDGFLYADDTFRTTTKPAYATGARIPSGGFVGGALKVTLGEVDTTSVLGMSGAWTRTFTLTQPVTITLSLRYNLTQASEYEADEFSQMLVSVDGNLYGTSPNDYIAQVAGDGNGGTPITTGWQTFQLNLGTMGAGTHTLAIGGYNNKKTYSNEFTDILVDDVAVVSATPLSNQAPLVNAGTDGTINVNFNGTVTDDGLLNPVVTTWSKVSGPGTVTFGDSTAIDTTVSFSVPGTYVLRLTANDGEFSVSDEVSITSENPMSVGVQAVLGSLNYERFKETIQMLSNFGDRTQGSQSYANAAAWLEQQLQAAGYTVEHFPYTFQGQPRDLVYVTKVGSVSPDRMYIVSAHFDGRGGGGAADDDGSGAALVLEGALAVASPAIRTDISIRFIFWNNEETGLDGSTAYVQTRAPLQGIENPVGSGMFPEPRWQGIIQHDMILYDHGLPPQPNQIPAADMDIEYQVDSTMSSQSQLFANFFKTGNAKYGVKYPAQVGNNMNYTDSVPFQNLTPSISIRENQRIVEIGMGSNPNYHKATDLFWSYSEDDFRLGFDVVRTTVGTVAELAGVGL